jgi:hypothetical protein
MFTTPTHTSMRPCKFFLDGHCRFNEDKCKFSHGQTVPLEDLREFVEADHRYGSLYVGEIFAVNALVFLYREEDVFVYNSTTGPESGSVTNLCSRLLTSDLDFAKGRFVISSQCEKRL